MKTNFSFLPYFLSRFIFLPLFYLCSIPSLLFSLFFLVLHSFSFLVLLFFFLSYFLHNTIVGLQPSSVVATGKLRNLNLLFLFILLIFLVFFAYFALSHSFVKGLFAYFYLGELVYDHYDIGPIEIEVYLQLLGYFTNCGLSL